MLTVGLTGSIAVGKTFVCELLRDAGIRVLDADVTAREVVAAGTRGLDAVVTEFGIDVLTPEGGMDRKKVGEIVFRDEAKRRALNAIIHPLVFEAQDQWIRDQTAIDPNGIAVVDAALMIESGGYKRFDKLVVVWCENDIQLQRLVSRDGFDEKTAKMRIASQMPQDEKKRFADYLVNTSNGIEDTRRQVGDLITQLRELASKNS
jgi:dephospho-CoA kinase